MNNNAALAMLILAPIFKDTKKSNLVLEKKNHLLALKLFGTQHWCHTTPSQVPNRPKRYKI